MWRRRGFRAETFDICINEGHDVLNESGFKHLVALILRQEPCAKKIAPKYPHYKVVE